MSVSGIIGIYFCVTHPILTYKIVKYPIKIIYKKLVKK